MRCPPLPELDPTEPDAVSEGDALGKPYGVAAGERHQVLEVQSMRIEVGEKLREVKEWRRKIGVCCIPACSS
ncbi:hypothetical protein CR513_01641, partial [Mucuna pruriens]